MIRFTALALGAGLLLSPVASFAAQGCTPAEQAAAQYSNSRLSCSQWVAQFNGHQSSEQARNDRAPAPRS